MFLAVVSLTVLGAVCGQNFNGGDAGWYCGILGNEDCSTHDMEPRCGTNGITYRNMCALGQAHCADSTINQAYEGTCTLTKPPTTEGPHTDVTTAGGAAATTTRSQEQVVHGSEVILDLQCVMLSHRECTHNIGEKICGTDGRTYEDFCEYEKARCTHRNLHVAHLGDCSA